MGSCNKLFYQENSTTPTLRSRISLTRSQLEIARLEKDKLLDDIKPKLNSKFNIEVKHWLQGSYKNRTLTKSGDIH